MDRIRTGLEVILALFLELRLLKKLTHYIFLAGPQSQHYPTDQKFSHPHSNTLTVYRHRMAGVQETELSSEDTVHI